jgi:hypothetical protein
MCIIPDRASIDARSASIAVSFVDRNFWNLGRHGFVFPRHVVPEFCIFIALRKSRGRREGRVPIAPMGPVQQKARG